MVATPMQVPPTMRAIEAAAFGLDQLRLVERPVPRPGPGEILVRIKAASLELSRPRDPQRDLQARPAAALRAGVRRLRRSRGLRPWRLTLPDPRPGDADLHAGLARRAADPVQRTQRTLGAPLTGVLQPLTGVLQDYVAVPAEDAVAAPAHLSDVEAATLPIAALTAWSTLQEGGIKPGDWVLVVGTGGVALFALQFAKLAGARVVVLSSSEDKLARVRALGADATINYRTLPDWSAAVREAAGGRGVDLVVETGGATLPKALTATALGGFVGVVGFVGGVEVQLKMTQLLGPMIRVQSGCPI